MGKKLWSGECFREFCHFAGNFEKYLLETLAASQSQYFVFLSFKSWQDYSALQVGQPVQQPILWPGSLVSNSFMDTKHSYTGVGMEAIERLRFLASFGPPSTGKRKGGQKTQPFNGFHSLPGIRMFCIHERVTNFDFDFLVFPKRTYRRYKFGE